MEFRHIRSFLSVAETLHFGRSARLLNLSQPALSLQVKALEDELGIQLLSRNRQGTVLTEAGQEFREDARVALEKLEFAKRKAQWHQQADSAIFASVSYRLPVLRWSRT
jgi:DNA-binding transcriptional LysR family regulator